jgi:hypothetical protein
VQQWEYMTWKATAFEMTPVVSLIDGQQPENRLSVEDALQGAGAEGWELVAVTQSQMFYSYFFKRPKE